MAEAKPYTIGLKKAFNAERPRRANKAINVIRAFMRKHFRAKDENILISNLVNQAIWADGREHIPRKIKVQVLESAGKIHVYLEGEEIPMEENGRTNLLHYFSNLETSFYVWIVLGVAGLIIPLALGSPLFSLAGLIFFLPAYKVAYEHYNQLPTDKGVSRIIGMDLQGYAEVALDKLGLSDADVVGNYIYLWSPLERDVDDMDNYARLVPLRLKRGKDGLYRFVFYSVRVLVPTENYIGVFSCTHCLLDGRYSSYQTGEYFYKDVVSIKTKDGRQLALSFADGDTFLVEIPSDELAKYIYQSHHVPFKRFDLAVQAIRKMIQAHKELELLGE